MNKPSIRKKENLNHVISELLIHFLNANNVLRTFKCNSARYMFLRYEQNHIMGYINPKYCNASLAQGPDIFEWNKTKEGYEFWDNLNDTWRQHLAHKLYFED